MSLGLAAVGGGVLLALLAATALLYYARQQQRLVLARKKARALRKAMLSSSLRAPGSAAEPSTFLHSNPVHRAQRQHGATILEVQDSAAAGRGTSRGAKSN